MAMASMAARSIRALRWSTKPTSLVAAGKRRFSASAHDDAYETEKWEKITYAGIATCTILAIYNLSKGHPHYDPPPPYPYLHIRNKEFPWATKVPTASSRRNTMAITNVSPPSHLRDLVICTP